MDGFLSILLFDQINKVVFRFKNKEKSKDDLYISFKSKDIRGSKIVSKNEASLKKMIITIGLRKTSESRYLQIDFLNGDKQESLILDVGKELDEVSTTIGLMIGNLSTKSIEKPKEIESTQTTTSEIQELAPEMPSKPCSVCLKNEQSFFVKSDNLCVSCFHKQYGKILLKGEVASYYGGHKAYLAGGLLSKEELGKLYLTEKHVIFTKNEKDLSKRWSIIIPLASIDVGSYSIEEKTRRQQVSGIGSSPVDGVFGGTGFIHESGKEHHLVIPYVDENGIPQSPRFGVTSFRGKAIREFAAELYNQLVKLQEKSSPQTAPTSNIQAGQKTETVQTRESPLLVLKMRLAKGEITKEEYEELREMLE